MIDPTWAPTALDMDSLGKSPPILESEQVNFRFRTLFVVRRLLTMCLSLLWLKLTGRWGSQAAGEVVRTNFQRLGVLWVKAGQMISMRSDVLPRSFCEALAHLQEQAAGFPPQRAKKIIETELGRPLEEVFSSFQDAPVAAASIAQVHKAVLRNGGHTVAVKVRRPEIEHVFEKDMGLIRWIVRCLVFFSIASYFRWEDLLWEVEEVFAEELDYRFEITNQKRLRANLLKHDIYVPAVFPACSTRTILVMEFVEGISVATYLKAMKHHPAVAAKWLAENNVDPAKVGVKLLHSFLRQILEDNLFHADLHPANLIMMRDNRLALIDLGSLGSLDGDLLRKYDLYLEALSMGRYAKAIDIFLLMMPDLPSGNLAPLKDDMLRRLQAWGSRCLVEDLPYREKSASAIFDEMMQITGENGVVIFWAMFKILRGWTSLDASLRELMPRENLAALVMSYNFGRRMREVRGEGPFLLEDVLKLQDIIDRPTEMMEQAVYKGAMFRRLAQVFEGATGKVSRLFANLLASGSVGSLLITGILFGAYRYQHGDPDQAYVLEGIYRQIPYLDQQVWFLLFLLLLYAITSMMRLSQRFRSEERVGPGIA